MRRGMTRGLRPPTLATSIVSSSPTMDDSAQPERRLIRSASGIGVRSPTAMSFQRIAADGDDAGVPEAAALEMAKSVVPPPISTSATPNSFSIRSQNRFARGELLEHGVTDGDAGAVHARDDVLRRRHAARDDVNVDLEPRPRHADGRADAILLIDDEILREHVENLASGRESHRFGGFDGADVLARDLARLFPATATTPRLLNALT